MDTKQPEALALANTALQVRNKDTPDDVYVALGDCAWALRNLHAENEQLRAGYDAARLEIASLHTQMEAVGAGGMEPLRKREYPPLVCDYCGALTPDPWHSSGMLHGKMSKHIHSCDACAARGAAQALDAKGGRWLTVVYRDIAAGQEARELGEHPKACALSWSHALNERDAAIAAQQGGANG